MKIDKRLNLIVPIYADEEVARVDHAGKPVLDDAGKPIMDTPIVAYIHSTPLGEAVVDRYFMVLGQTYNAIFSQGLGFAAGPGHAMRVLRHIATEKGVWHDDPKRDQIGIERGLVEEMRRLTNVIALGKEGRWDVQLPLQVASDQGVISEEDRREVENAIAFFIVAYATLNRAQREGVLTAAGDIWGAQLTSLTCTEWSNFLRTSTGTVNSGAKSPAPASEKPEHANATVDSKPRSVPV
jgi:hypothetical protein